MGDIMNDLLIELYGLHRSEFATQLRPGSYERFGGSVANLTAKLAYEGDNREISMSHGSTDPRTRALEAQMHIHVSL